MIGVIVNCLKANLYNKPDIHSGTICMLDMLTEVVIDEKESSDGFYKVYISSGIEGFCEKKYIAIRQ